MKIKLYLDEDVPLAFAQALINRGVNVFTTQTVKMMENLMRNNLTMLQKKEERYLPIIKETL